MKSFANLDQAFSASEETTEAGPSDFQATTFPN